jgi:hypothetical protein
VFPTADGHVVETRCPGVPIVHRLRDSFATTAHAAGIDWMSPKVLVNHSLPGESGNVTAGYVRPGLETLRAAAQRIADALDAGMAGSAPLADAG